MKTLLTLVGILAIVTTGSAQSGTAKSAATDEAAQEKSSTAPSKSTKAPIRIVIPPKGEEKKAAPAKKAEAKKKEPEKKEERTIKGVVVPRGEKGFLGVEIVGAQFKITFYDKEKKPVKPDVARAALRWDPKYKVGQDRLVLNPDADGTSLSSPRSVRPPYNFKLFITLINDPGESENPVGETHVIDFKA